MAKMTAGVEDVASTSRFLEGCPARSPKDAETRTSQLLDAAAILVGASQDWTQAANLPIRRIFDDVVLQLFDDLSRSILSDTRAHRFQDVVAFALWCRRSALKDQKARYEDGSTYLGRGLVFHVSPSNVPIMFAYTLAMGLLSGNANVVRLPSRPFPQVDYLCRQIDRLLRLDSHRGTARYITCLRYPRESIDITTLLSAQCDVRVIWGGDTTVREIRKAPLQPGAFDMVFPDRYSLAVIDADAWLNCADKKRHIRGFYNDTYLSDQTSCSSPRLVLWLGTRIEAARADFWSLLEELVTEREGVEAAQSVRKLEYSYGILARHPSAKLCTRRLDVGRVWCDELEPELLDQHPGGGVFVESSARSVLALAPLLRRRCQTISFYGVPGEELAALLCDVGSRGGDRIVPMGRTLDFSLTWDGYDTIRTLSRRVDLVAADSRGRFTRGSCGDDL